MVHIFSHVNIYIYIQWLLICSYQTKIKIVFRTKVLILSVILILSISNWLVVSTPLRKYESQWKDYPIYEMENKIHV